MIRCPRIAFTALPETHISRVGCRAAWSAARAITSGWKIGGTGFGFRGSRVRTTELGRVHGGKLQHADLDAALLVEQLAAERVGEAADRGLGGAIGALQRDRPVHQRRADLEDDALPLLAHVLERG